MPGAKKERGSVEESVRSYLMSHRDAFSLLKKRTANISKLGRDIREEHPGLSMSSIRYSLNKIMEESAGSRDEMTRVDRLLAQSKITLQDKVTVLTSPSPLRVKYISATYLTDSIVYIVDETVLGSIPQGDGISVERDVSLVHIFSSRDIEKVPGFVMRIAERLFSSEVNILQLISCANETIIVVRKGDGVKVYRALVA